MLGNGVKMGIIFRRIQGPLFLGWAPNHFVLGAQLVPGEKRLVGIPASPVHCGHTTFTPGSQVKYLNLAITKSSYQNFACRPRNYRYETYQM